MKTLIAISMILLAGAFNVRSALIPFSDFYVSVETNDFLHRDEGKHGLRVSVHLGNFDESNMWQASVDVLSFEFSASIRDFNEQDRKLFLEASRLAKERKEFSTTVLSPAIPGQVETRFESTQVNGAWKIRVTRKNEKAVFDPDEGDRLRDAMAEAEAGQAWFMSLLTADSLPVATAQAHPPRSKGYYLVSKIGEVDCRGFIYQVSLDADPYRNKVSYHTGHTIEFGGAGSERGSIGGDWSEMLRCVAQGFEAQKKNAEYDFVAEDRKYHVELNRDTKEVDVTLARSDFFSDRRPVVGHFSATQLHDINELIAQVPAHQAWFEQHEGLFFTR